MGLLDQLWDDTVAGPQPENGLGKLRKHNKTFSVRAGSGKESCEGSVRSYDEESVAEEALKVTRRIMIVKPPGYQSASPPVSPAGSSTPPVSPFSGTKEAFRFRRRSTSDAYEKVSQNRSSSSSSPFDV